MTKERRDVVKYVMGSALGCLMIGAKKAKADPASVGILADISGSVTIIAKAMDAAADKYNKIAKASNNMLDSLKNTHNIVESFQNMHEDVKKQKQSFKNTSDKFYAVGKDPLSNRVPYVRPDSEPIISSTTELIEEMSNVTKKSINPSKRYVSNARASYHGAHSLGKIGAGDIRDKIERLKKSSAASTSDKEANAEKFAKVAEPVKVDQNQLILESLVRQEKILIGIYESLNGQHSKTQSLDKTDYESALRRYKNGKGTTI